MIKRRELFSSLVSFGKKEQESFYIRPPYFEDSDSFAQLCIQCDGKCSTVCEEEIIIIKEDRTPILDFKKSGCTYCDKCAKACEFGVLSLEYKQNIKAKIKIDMLKCMSWNNSICFSCKESCLDDAIEYLGLFRPKIDLQKCTSCGFCVGVCPCEAIKVEKCQ